MDEVRMALYIGVIIGTVVTVVVRPLADYITRAITDAWRKHKEAQ